VLALRDYRLLFWADGLTSLAAAAVFAALWTGARAGAEAGGGRTPGRVGRKANRRGPASGSSDPAVAAPAGSRSPWRDIPFLSLMLVWLVWSSVFVQLLTTFPLYMRDVYGLAENRIGQLFAVNTIIIVTLEMILMEKIRKHSQARAINISFVLLGIGVGMMPFGRGTAFGALTVAVWTFGEMLSMPLVTALIAGRADDSNRGQYMGLFSLSFSLAFIIAPAGGTAIYEHWGPDAVWYVCSGVCFLLAVVFSILRPYLDRAGSQPGAKIPGNL
jgi:predicted MFS family arabinose efflux permease